MDDLQEYKLRKLEDWKRKAIAERLFQRQLSVLIILRFWLMGVTLMILKFSMMPTEILIEERELMAGAGMKMRESSQSLFVYLMRMMMFLLFTNQKLRL